MAPPLQPHPRMQRMKWRTRGSYDFRGRCVVLTGGSRGLGLEIARILAAEGASVALLSRDPEELATAKTELERTRGAKVTVLSCDVSEPGEVRAAIELVLGAYGHVDVLFNNAGIIQVGPAEAMEERDYERAMATHFWGPLRGIEAVLPSMKARHEGRIVNIASFGGMVALPHLAPYSASKFALVGLSDALRAELDPSGIRVTTVCPGVMRTGSHLNVSVKGDHRREFTWFALGAGSPLVSMSADRAARKIVEACRRGDASLRIGLTARAMIVANALMPSTVGAAMKVANRLLPANGSPRGHEERTGWDSRSRLAPSLLTRLADRAATRNNELRGHASVRAPDERGTP